MGITGIIGDLTAVTLTDEFGNWIETLPDAWPTADLGSQVLIFLTRWYLRMRVLGRATHIRAFILITVLRRCTLTRRVLTWVQLS